MLILEGQPLSYGGSCGHPFQSAKMPYCTCQCILMAACVASMHPFSPDFVIYMLLINFFPLLLVTLCHSYWNCFRACVLVGTLTSKCVCALFL